MQGYISHELTMNNGMGCDKECSDYSYQRIETCREGVYCLDQPICKNNLVRCDRIGPIVDVCLSVIPKNEISIEISELYSSYLRIRTAADCTIMSNPTMLNMVIQQVVALDQAKHGNKFIINDSPMRNVITVYVIVVEQ